MTGLVITSMGAVTSVGRDALCACAAIRARITRPSPLSYFREVVAETQEEAPLTGHPIRGYTEGFDLTGRWLRLALGGVESLLGSAGAPKAGDVGFWSRTGLVAVLPHREDLLRSHAPQEDGAMVAPTALALRKRLRLAIPEQRIGLVARGHAGVAVAIEQARQWLEGSGLERVLVVAADSYLTPLPLKRLERQRRLKSQGRPVGLQPGEAGVAFLLETAVGARRRNARVLARVSAVATALELVDERTPRLFSGAALAGCLQQVMEPTGGTRPFAGEILVDLTGEEWRARLWGSALVRTRFQEAPRVRSPASSVGDTGAASGALGICLAAHGFLRPWVGSSGAVVVSCSDDGRVGCVALLPAVGGAGAEAAARLFGAMP
ncbi:hypothetical protein Q664_00900 [Archangium violaceum Cb vi76]|uniref:Beta-ketoacyl synthase N-terminal domain-containing protein n=1 Tax=Archangium violaceum Cb vi76 TaxID=1406225 RepID=A0A084T228_9BACT|nr:hypothetical protein Q664_00900 [Archangium violaceum Cb vi76]